MYTGSSEYRRRLELQGKQSVKPQKRRRRPSQLKKKPALPPATITSIKQEPSEDFNVGSLPGCSHAFTGGNQASQQSVCPPELSIPMLGDLIKAEGELMNQDSIMDCCKEIFDEKRDDLFTAVCHLMDHQLYSFVKWARTLPLYKDLKVSSNHFLYQLYSFVKWARTLPLYKDLKVSSNHFLYQLYSFVKWARTLPLYKDLKVSSNNFLQCHQKGKWN